jgi:Clostripain family
MTQAEWSILVYIAAHNNLDSSGERSRDQILNFGSTESVKLSVLFDSWMGATRHIAAGPGSPAVNETRGAFDSGDPKNLAESALWAFQQRPAKRYGLVLWSHGNGHWDQKELNKIAKQMRGPTARVEEAEREASGKTMALFRSTLQQIAKTPGPAERAVLFDDGTGNSVDTLELEKVCAAITAGLNQKLDLIGMDACLMATLEVAYQIRGHVDTMVASEELVPGRSWPYDAILQRLNGEPGMSAGALGACIVEEYRRYYEADPPALNKGDVTKVALDLKKIDRVADAVKALSGALTTHLRRDCKALHAAQRAAYMRETFKNKRAQNSSKFGYHLWDIATLATGLAHSAAHADVTTAAHALAAAVQPGPQHAVLAEAHLGEWFDGIGGLTLYMAPPRLPVSTAYNNLALAQYTAWGKLLAAYKDELGAI